MCLAKQVIFHKQNLSLLFYILNSDLENMLRPDFDMVKDKIVYALLLLGLVLFPTSMMGGSTPVECQYCMVSGLELI